LYAPQRVLVILGGDLQDLPLPHSALVPRPGNLENVRKLLEHPAFDMKNPNKVYSLIGGFASSAVNFHAATAVATSSWRSRC
jgi:aminopeptidase N